jgi:hypothetical protein
VPGWLAGYDAAATLASGPVERAVRRLLRHDRVLTDLEAERRAGYDDDVCGQAARY